jgi:hypothetical protein
VYANGSTNRVLDAARNAGLVGEFSDVEQRLLGSSDDGLPTLS